MSGLTPKHLEIMFGQLQGCCLDDPVWTPVDVAGVLCSVQDVDGCWKDSAVPDSKHDPWKDGTESTSYTVVRLKDGRFGLLSESEVRRRHERLRQPGRPAAFRRRGVAERCPRRDQGRG